MIALRIAFVIDAAFPWSIGGVEATETGEARALAKEHEVHYFSMRWPGMARSFTKDGIRYHTSFGVNRKAIWSGGHRSVLQALRFAAGVFGLFRYRFDVVQTDAFPFVHLPVLKLYRSLRHCKLVVDTAEVWSRDYWVEYLGIAGALAWRFMLFALRGADHYIANSNDTAGRLADIGVARDKISVFAPVIDVNLVREVLSEGHWVERADIIFDGRLIREKRLDKWLETVRLVRERNPMISALIVGEGPEEEAVRSLINIKGLSGSVKLRPFYDDKRQLFQAIAGSTVFFMTSEREGLSTITLESIALGTPVVVPEDAVLPTEVKELCVVRDYASLPDTILDMLSSNDKGSFIPNRKRIENFYATRTVQFYTYLFDRLGLDGRNPGPKS